MSQIHAATRGWFPAHSAQTYFRPSDARLRRMRAPAGVDARRWEAASPQERRVILKEHRAFLRTVRHQAQHQAQMSGGAGASSGSLGQMAAASPQPQVNAGNVSTAPTSAAAALAMAMSVAETGAAGGKAASVSNAIATQQAQAAPPAPAPAKKKKKRRGLRGALKKIGDHANKQFKKLMKSKIFAAVCMVCRFIPVLQFAVLVIDAVKAAYTLYQGIKQGSFSMILGGVAGLASGVGGVASAMGATTLAQTANTVASVASKASAVHAAIAKKDWAAGLAAVSSIGSNAGGRVDNFISNLGKAKNVYDSVKSGDYLGAAAAGANALNGDSKNSTLKGIEQAAATASNIKNKNYGAAVAGAAGLGATLNDGKSNSNLDALAQVGNAATAVKNKDYGGAAQSLAGAADAYTRKPEDKDTDKNEGNKSTWTKAANALSSIDTAAKALKRNDYAGAINAGVAAGQEFNANKPNDTLDALSKVGKAADFVKQGEMAARKNDYLGAVNAGSNAVSLFGDVKKNDVLATGRSVALAAAGLYEARDAARSGDNEEAVKKGSAALSEAGLVKPKTATTLGNLAASGFGLHTAVKTGNYVEAAKQGVNLGRELNGGESNKTLDVLAQMSKTYGRVDHLADAAQKRDFKEAFNSGNELLNMVQRDGVNSLFVPPKAAQAR
jgi:hypothetical protein